VGVAQAGAWKYAFIYDLVHRFYPDLPQQARPIRQAEARRKLAELYLQSVGAAPEKALASLFGWSKGDAETTLSALVQDGLALKDTQLANQPGQWVVLSQLMQM
jgi:uncharacterized protein YcaQ